MIRLFAPLLCLGLGLGLAAPAARAQELPALYAVTGVAAGDVLNIRATPDPDAAIVGTLPPDATGVEVVAVDGDWAVLNANDGTGYAALRFLQREDGPAWNALETPLACVGTEPFWSLGIDPATGTTTYQTPEMAAPLQSLLSETWPGTIWAPAAAFSLTDGLAVLQPGECSDGMSDRTYGIVADIFLRAINGDAGPTRLSGCCRIVAP